MPLHTLYGPGLFPYRWMLHFHLFSLLYLHRDVHTLLCFGSQSFEVYIETEHTDIRKRQAFRHGFEPPSEDLLDQ